MPEPGPLPSEDDVRGYFELCSNWGRWGPDDNAGTVNLITPEVRRAAAGLVRSGRAISLSRPWNTVGGRENTTPAQHFVQASRWGSMDYFGIFYHGVTTTHIDALCHVFWEGRGWNGRPWTDVTSYGGRFGTVDAWKDGIATRGVLLDIPRLRGSEYVTPEAPVRGWELEAAAAAQGVALRPGDAVLVYAGRERFYAAHPELDMATRPVPGLHADVCPVLKRSDAALLVWDMMDAQPCGYPLFEQQAMALPVHVFAIVYMGMPLLDNALLEPLARACIEEGRWEFLLTVNPLYVRRATGSPVNPVALF